MPTQREQALAWMRGIDDTAFSVGVSQSTFIHEGEMGLGLMGMGLMGLGVAITPGPDTAGSVDTIASHVHLPRSAHDKAVAVDHTRQALHPAPGPTGLHDYEVIVCDKYGAAYGQIVTAIPTAVDWELDDIDAVTFTFWVFDATAACLPMSSLPGGREIQIWRDQVLIWWGWPTDASVNNTTVTITCSGFFWALNNLLLGPVLHNYLLNANFNNSATSFAPWTEFGSSDPEIVTASSGYVLEGTYSLRMEATSTGVNGVQQTIDMSLHPEVTVGAVINLAVWVYIDDPSETSLAGAEFNFGLYASAVDVFTDLISNSAAQLDDTTPKNQWVRLSTSITWPSTGRYLNVLLYAPVATTYWNVADASYEEAVAGTGTLEDVYDIISGLVGYAQDETQGKTPLALPMSGSMVGTSLVRQYLYSSNANIFQAIQEFSTIGLCDYGVTWDETGHFRYFTVYPGQKGMIQYGWPIAMDDAFVTAMSGSVSGTQVGTAQRVLGQGSSGSSSEIGYSAFPSMIGEGEGAGFPGGMLPRVLSDSEITTSSIICPTGAFTSDDLGQPLFDIDGLLAVGTVVVSVISSTEVQFNNGFAGSRPPNNTGTGITVGIGGVLVDKSQSAVANAPVGTLQGTAEGYLGLEMAPQVIPTLTLRADGARGLIGRVFVGDIVPVQINFGWYQIGGTTGNPYLMRVVKMSLNPVTEEVSVTLNVIPQPDTSITGGVWTLDDPVLGILDAGNLIS